MDDNQVKKAPVGELQLREYQKKMNIKSRPIFYLKGHFFTAAVVSSMSITLL